MIDDKVTQLINSLGIVTTDTDKPDMDSIDYIHESSVDFKLLYTTSEGTIEYSFNEKFMLPLSFGKSVCDKLDINDSVEVFRINLKNPDGTSYSGSIFIYSEQPEQLYASIRTETYDTHLLKIGNITYYPNSNSGRPLENHPDIPLLKFAELYQKLHVKQFKTKNQERIDSI